MTTIEQSVCPECNAVVPVAETAQPTEILVCPGCSADLEVLATGPAVLAVAPEVEEDWGE
uniref:Lysine biosynthesis protein LysW n=1 Tax=uncultured bacterium esnapd17 TaxID=1366598 RepID=S5TV34_9BACT|nr:hypothetical protein [uncultured bacterium esnapd17]